MIHASQPLSINATLPVLEARYDSNGAFFALLGSLLLAAICIWAGEHYALIGGLLGLIGLIAALVRLADRRIRLRLDDAGIHLPLTASTITWHEVEQASWKTVTRGASQQTFIVLSLTNGHQQQIELTRLDISLEQAWERLEHQIV